MAFREHRKTGETAELDPNQVSTYLLSKGYILGPGGLACGLDGLVRADIDANVPEATFAADIDAFQPAADPLRAARTQLITAARAIKAKPAGTRTEIEKTLLALIVLLRSDG